jgi:hypothetical protein
MTPQLDTSNCGTLTSKLYKQSFECVKVFLEDFEVCATASESCPGSRRSRSVSELRSSTGCVQFLV